jgi:carbon monoxide dehydrogenase subunit G
MGLRFEHAFVVKAPASAAWSYLTDPYRVAPALPGAAITEKVDEQTYKGTITMKVGPVSARYKGTVRFEKLDPAAHTAEIAASGQDVTGRGGADMKMSSRLVEKGAGETEVSVVSEVNVTGILAQFGRGLMQDVSNQMFQRFTEAMRAELETHAAPGVEPPGAAGAVGAAATAPGGAPLPEAAARPAAAPPIEVVSFGSRILGQAALRGVRQPVVWVTAAVVLVLIYWLSR